MALITCENVSIGYEGQTVVKELNFSIERGDYLCIVGENGSGKSTLVKSLLGLKGADRGKIIYGDGLKKNEIGYLPQKNEEQKGFPASVYEVVLSGRLNGRGWKPFYRKEDKEAAAEKMEMLDQYFPCAGHRLFSAQIPADCLDMAAFALFYTDPRICYVFDHRTGFPQEQDV